MTNDPKFDEAIVEGTRRFLANRRMHRWEMLVYGILFLCLCFFCTWWALRRLEQEPQQMTTGFFVGIFFGMICLLFGLLGAVGVARFLTGLRGQLRSRELLVTYHDRLRDMGELSKTTSGEQGAAPNAAPPHR